jgi:hypothetical protein
VWSRQARPLPEFDDFSVVGTNACGCDHKSIDRAAGLQGYAATASLLKRTAIR